MNEIPNRVDFNAEVPNENLIEELGQSLRIKLFQNWSRNAWIEFSCLHKKC